MSKYFSKLNYSLGDEDSMPEYNLLPFDSGHVVAVAGSGGRIVPLIAKRPKSITSVDILSEQLDLTELRVEAIRQLEFQDFMGLFGYPEYQRTASSRKTLFASVKLKPQTQTRLMALFDANRWGPIIYMGEFEGMLIKVSKLIRLIVGKHLDRLFEFDDIEQQRAFVHSDAFPYKRWKLALKLFGNATALNALLYRGDFPKKNLPGSTYSIYKKMFADLMDNVLCKDSYFFQMLILGKLIASKTAMMEADPEVFKQIKESLKDTQVNYQQGDIISVVDNIDGEVDFISISDVPSFMPDEAADAFLANVQHKLSPSARVVSRGHLRVVKPKTEGFRNMTEDSAPLIKGERTSLWHIQMYEKI
jgi:S-adenosylmethionine-diacylglycerol 3-amino-3-carboxypropyl transferase